MVEGWKAAYASTPEPTGTILVEASEREEVGVVLYARVSSTDQKADLDRQVARLVLHSQLAGRRSCHLHGLTIRDNQIGNGLTDDFPRSLSKVGRGWPRAAAGSAYPFPTGPWSLRFGPAP